MVPRRTDNFYLILMACDTKYLFFFSFTLFAFFLLREKKLLTIFIYFFYLQQKIPLGIFHCNNNTHCLNNSNCVIKLYIFKKFLKCWQKRKQSPFDVCILCVLDGKSYSSSFPYIHIIYNISGRDGFIHFPDFSLSCLVFCLMVT